MAQIDDDVRALVEAFKRGGKAETEAELKRRHPTALRYFEMVVLRDRFVEALKAEGIDPKGL